MLLRMIDFSVLTSVTHKHDDIGNIPFFHTKAKRKMHRKVLENDIQYLYVKREYRVKFQGFENILTAVLVKRNKEASACGFLQYHPPKHSLLLKYRV